MLSILSDMYRELNRWWEFLFGAALFLVVGIGMLYVTYLLGIVCGKWLIIPAIITGIGTIFSACGALYGLWLSILTIK